MLENASRSAYDNSDQNTPATPLVPTHIQLTPPVADKDETEEIEIVLGKDNSNSTPTVVELDSTDSQLDEEEPEVDNDRGTKLDPNYTARPTPGNTDRRSTRASRDPSIPHCSLLIQAFKYCATQTTMDPTSNQEPPIDTISFDSLLHVLATQQTNH